MLTTCIHARTTHPCPAVGCAKLGQLLVWEWRSDSYVLKQQGHYHNISTTAFSPDGALVATGSDDRKVCVCVRVCVNGIERREINLCCLYTLVIPGNATP